MVEEKEELVKTSTPKAKPEEEVLLASNEKIIETSNKVDGDKGATQIIEEAQKKANDTAAKKKVESNPTEEAKETRNEKSENKEDIVVYKVQIMASAKDLPLRQIRSTA